MPVQAHAPPALPSPELRADLSAEATVPASPEDVFGFLADLGNHWAIAGERVEVVELTGPPGAHDGGVVRLAGPLGIGRVARTRVVAAHAPEWMRGSARLGGRTEATVWWRIEPGPGGSRVRLAAAVERAGALDRALLALGGRRWLERLFREALERLRERLDGSPSGTEPVPRAEPAPLS